MDLGALVPGLITGGASVVGSLVGAGATNQATNAATANVAAANAENEKIASENRAFQAQMSGTAYQRAVADMRAAGLNPAVMMQGAGSSASTPSGSALPVQNAADAIMAGAREKSRLFSSMTGSAVESAGDALQAMIAPAQKKLAEASATNALKQGQILDTQSDLMQRQVVGKEIANQADALDLQIRQAQNAFYLKHPSLYPIREALKDVSTVAGGGLGSAVGGAVGAALGGRGRSSGVGAPVRNPSSFNYTEDR